MLKYSKSQTKAPKYYIIEKCMQLTSGVPLKQGFGEKEDQEVINLYREGLESKLTLLPVFPSNCIEIIDTGSLIN